MSRVVNTSQLVNHHFERLVLGGNSRLPGSIDRSLRRRGAQRLGMLGYAALATREADEGRGARVELVASRIQHLFGTLRPSGRDPEADHRAYRRTRRLTTWDAWAQAAMAAEDLEMLLTALSDWRTDGADVFDRLGTIKTRGPAFFSGADRDWLRRLSGITRLPNAPQLTPPLSPVEAELLASGLSNSVREAADDLLALAAVVPWDVRLAMMPYKHGFRWIVPSIAPMATDPIGLRRLTAASASAFVVETIKGTALLFTASDDEIEAARAATVLSSELEIFLLKAVLSEVQSRSGVWGVALYGDSASDVAQQTLLRRVDDWLRRR